MKDTQITIYKDVYSTDAKHIALFKVLERIKTGSKSGATVRYIRTLQTKDEQNKEKLKLPAICFSGVIPTGAREDLRIETHSGLVTLDFDDLTPDVYAEKKRFFIAQKFTVSAFLSPRGNGLKVIVRIADCKRHREHYKAILKEFPGLDPQNINPSRVCFESFDPEIYINYEAEPYTTVIELEKEFKADVTTDTVEIFKKLEKWLQNKSQAFESGQRNIYVFHLAGACCRYGINKTDCEQMIHQEYLSRDNTFRLREMLTTVKSAYHKNQSLFGTCEFSNERFVEKENRKEAQRGLLQTARKGRFPALCFILVNYLILSFSRI